MAGEGELPAGRRGYTLRSVAAGAEKRKGVRRNQPSPDQGKLHMRSTEAQLSCTHTAKVRVMRDTISGAPDARLGSNRGVGNKADLDGTLRCSIKNGGKSD